jgi:hypothetical protein
MNRLATWLRFTCRIERLKAMCFNLDEKCKVVNGDAKYRQLAFGPKYMDHFDFFRLFAGAVTKVTAPAGTIRASGTL